jgi:hypothetical protein
VGEGGTLARPPSVQPGDEPSQLGAGIRARDPSIIPTQAGQPDRLQFRGEVPMQVGSTTIVAQQGSGRLASPAARANVIIPDLGAYPQITAQLAAEGLSGPAVNRAVSEALRTGRGSPTVMNLVAVLFGAEPARQTIASATSVLALQSMERGGPTERIFGAPGAGPVRGELFGGERLDPELSRRSGQVTRPGGGVAPFTAVGASPAGTRTEQRIIGGQSFREGTQIARRSEADLLRTVELVYQAVRNMDFKDTGGLRREILQLFDMFDRAAGVRR